MRNALFLAVIAFAVTLAIIVANRLSNEAMAVVVGALCGISASIPVSIGLIIAASRHWGREQGYREIEYDYESRRYVPQPPAVIVLPPQNAQPPWGYANPPYYFPSPPVDASFGSREFKIVGDDMDETRSAVVR